MLTFGRTPTRRSASVSIRGSRTTRTSIVDGVGLQIDERLADAAERAWGIYAAEFLPDHAEEVPTRAHLRTLANRLVSAARRRQARTVDERSELTRMDRAAQTLESIANLVDGVRGGALPNRPRNLNRGDRVKVRGKVPFAGMESGKVYEVHETMTRGGARVVSFRLVDTLGRASKHEIGPFRAGAVDAMIKPFGDEGIGGALVVERIAPVDLQG